MILDAYKLQNVIFQITYRDAFELWDHAGRISRRMSNLWGKLTNTDGLPNQQTLEGPGVQIQTTINHATVTVRDRRAFDAPHMKRVAESFRIWREELALAQYDRVSTRARFVRAHDTIGEANAAILNMGVVKWPSEKVFGQPIDADANGVSVAFRFEDKESFAVLRVEAERLQMDVNLDPEFFSEGRMQSTKCRSVIDFDRGILAKTDAERFRVEEWAQGYLHVLRRDVGKILGGDRE